MEYRFISSWNVLRTPPIRLALSTTRGQSDAGTTSGYSAVTILLSPMVYELGRTYQVRELCFGQVWIEAGWSEQGCFVCFSMNAWKISCCDALLYAIKHWESGICLYVVQAIDDRLLITRLPLANEYNSILAGMRWPKKVRFVVGNCEFFTIFCRTAFDSTKWRILRHHYADQIHTERPREGGQGLAVPSRILSSQLRERRKCVAWPNGCFVTPNARRRCPTRRLDHALVRRFRRTGQEGQVLGRAVKNCASTSKGLSCADGIRLYLLSEGVTEVTSIRDTLFIR